jgi:hypothetical protein
MIPLSVGRQVGVVTLPEFVAVHTMHSNGRHDIYAKPIGGSVTIDVEMLIKALL